MASVVVRAPKIALISGSIRKGSFNSTLIKAAADVATKLGAVATIVDLKRFLLPVYDQDLEGAKGLPQAAVELKTIMKEQDGWIFSSPEYNGFPSPLLINTLTWLSRGDETPYATFAGKHAIVLSTSPGAMGGLRSLNPQRQLLTNLGVNVLAPTVAVGGASRAFDADSGALVDGRQADMLKAAVESLFYIARDNANREAHCRLIRGAIAGEYGSVSLPEAVLANLKQ